MKRRDILRTLPALGLGLAVAGVSRAAVQASPLRDAYFQWREAKRAYGDSGLDEGDPEEERLFQNVLAFERFACAYPAATMEDLAFKIIFADDDGHMSGSVQQSALVAAAYDIVGLSAVAA